MIANSLGYKHWRNVNVALPKAVSDFSQIQSAGLDVAGVVWMASRSAPRAPHVGMKVFLGGATPGEVDDLLAFLQSRGVEVGGVAKA
jgi:hypothetical protein